MFYWCTNQAIIQRTLACKEPVRKHSAVPSLQASSSCCGPFFITICGLICYRMSMDPAEGFFSAEHIANLAKTSDLAYPTLIPERPAASRCSASSQPCCSARSCRPLTRHSTASVTLYTLDIPPPAVQSRQATDAQLVRSRQNLRHRACHRFDLSWHRSSALLPPVCMTSCRSASASTPCRSSRSCW